MKLIRREPIKVRLEDLRSLVTLLLYLIGKHFLKYKYTWFRLSETFYAE